MDADPTHREAGDWVRGIVTSVVLGLVALMVIAVIAFNHLQAADAARYHCPTIDGVEGEVSRTFDGASCLYDETFRGVPTKGPFGMFQPFWWFVGSAAAIVGVVALATRSGVRAFRPEDRPPRIPRWTGVKA